MAQAILTRYLGPTDTRGSRIVATCQAGRMVVAWDFALNAPENHSAAAAALAKRFMWEGHWEAGQLPDGSYAHVYVPQDKP